MYNWFVDKVKIKSQTINAIMEEFDSLVNGNDESANYWIDDTHNVFAFINDNGGDDRWIEIHYELYDSNEDIIGDLFVLSTDDVDREELLEEIIVIIDDYYGN